MEEMAENRKKSYESRQKHKPQLEKINFLESNLKTNEEYDEMLSMLQKTIGTFEKYDKFEKAYIPAKDSNSMKGRKRTTRDPSQFEHLRKDIHNYSKRHKKEQKNKEKRQKDKEKQQKMSKNKEVQTGVKKRRK